MLNTFKLPLIFSLLLLSIGINSHIAAASSSSDISNDNDISNSLLPVTVDPGITGRSEVSYTGSLVLVLVALIFVVFLLYFTVKFISNKNRSFLSPKGIHSLGGIGVGQSSSVQVLHIADRIYIVGVGQQVTLLDKEDDPDVVASIVESFSSNNEPTFKTVKQWISQFSRNKNMNSGEDVNWNTSNHSPFASLLQDKLDKQAERKQQLESLLKDNKE